MSDHYLAEARPDAVSRAGLEFDLAAATDDEIAERARAEVAKGNLAARSALAHYWRAGAAFAEARRRVEAGGGDPAAALAGLFERAGASRSAGYRMLRLAQGYPDIAALLAGFDSMTAALAALPKSGERDPDRALPALSRADRMALKLDALQSQVRELSEQRDDIAWQLATEQQTSAALERDARIADGMAQPRAEIEAARERERAAMRRAHDAERALADARRHLKWAERRIRELESQLREAEAETETETETEQETYP